MRPSKDHTDAEILRVEAMLYRGINNSCEMRTMLFGLVNYWHITNAEYKVGQISGKDDLHQKNVHQLTLSIIDSLVANGSFVD